MTLLKTLLFTVLVPGAACVLTGRKDKDIPMTTTVQDTVTLVQTLFDLTNSHRSDSTWLDQSLALFAEDCKVVDVPSGIVSRGPEGYKQMVLFFEEGFPDSGVEIMNLFAAEDQAVIEFIGRGTNSRSLTAWNTPVSPGSLARVFLNGSVIH